MCAREPNGLRVSRNGFDAKFRLGGHQHKCTPYRGFSAIFDKCGFPNPIEPHICSPRKSISNRNNLIFAQTPFTETGEIAKIAIRRPTDLYVTKMLV
jgi:hypothetical protein